ncbi:MAG: circularly permuted type 2 ATP-grasp protein [Porticoccus sp.]|uniref:circularly permuted type 2 ATP-grasp protein n=1 Tax=Porticoccus hydrocarbonoclasticus TaxID=1073414 RepID=UPI00055A7969|nr:circularly permuted type 2 ATP-grasp protein [Porticoccus hydrocarbonoclasticus]MBG57353.1 circularly permuted type 2 ATP-grasp protein [Porticoccus sp.]|tara:strand:+ start:15145 stop:16590 length:1446 start_codon:yes stop_codon:yes gene_type:complete
MNKTWQGYNSSLFYDELLTSSGNPRTAARGMINFLQRLPEEEINERRSAAELAIRDMGISFTVYTEGGNIDRNWPFDIIPRTITAKEWSKISLGLQQRTRALNCFIDDIYNKQSILADQLMPADIVLESTNYKPQCRGVSPRYGAWAHICGSDLVRNSNGKFYVLEDNLRVPSGVSYMLENREITKRVLPELFENYSIQPVDDYPSKLYQTLASLSPQKMGKPCIVVLTPGIYNSAYFEHAFLAQSMGAELVEGNDLHTDDDDCVYMRTVDGPVKVDVVYRRIDEDFIDPEAFRQDSMLGVPGIMRAWKAGNVAIANAPGSGVADDKVIYAYVPDMIRYYLKQEPLIDSVKTYLCMIEKDREYVLANLDKLVVKPANESGGYGIMVGPHASTQTRREFAALIENNPRNYIAQPTLSLSTAPTYIDDTVEPRHLDLRPFILQGKDTWVTPGGLTRVAMTKGSLVVNSSQGGGSKDTWIVEGN